MMRIDVAVIGAGPYGLATAAHLLARGLCVRTFGEVMGSWKNNMPEGMLLKSNPRSSTIWHEQGFTLKQFYAERGIPYDGRMIAVPRETFVEYGKEFQHRFVRIIENKKLVSLEVTRPGFHARLDDGEVFYARHVVVAVGMDPFQFLPPIAADLPRELVSHSGDYGPIDRLKGKNVVVVGAGSSAIDLSAFLHDAGISVSLVTRRDSLPFAAPIRSRSLLERIRNPDSGIGESWPLMVASHAPWLINRMSDDFRWRAAYNRGLGPLGSPFMKDRLLGVPQFLGSRLSKATAHTSMIDLELSNESRTHTMRVDHVIFATGYKIDIARLPFLASMMDQIKTSNGAPRLFGHYETAGVPGLFFAGPASAPSFGPVCRFVHGTPHPARAIWARINGVSITRHPLSAIRGSIPQLDTSP